MGQNHPKQMMSRGPLRILDINQPEVKWALGITIAFSLFLIAISFYSRFIFFEEALCALFTSITSGLIGLIGVAVAGIALVITLFSSEQIKLIDQLKDQAFETLLYDFKWFAFFSAFEIIALIALVLVFKTPIPLIPCIPFYVIAFIFSYSFFYLLFYGVSLVGNLIKICKIKCTLDSIQQNTKNIPTIAIEAQLDFLISRLFHGDRQSSHEFYASLIGILEKSSTDNADIVEYLKSRYSNF